MFEIDFLFARSRFRRALNALSLLSALALGAVSVASAQVAVIPNVPAYPYQVLPGSNRQINVNITGGSLNTVNWQVLSATGGASATFTTPAASGAAAVNAGLPVVQVNFGTTAGNCSISGAMGSYAVTSTATVTIQAQSVDDPSKSGKFLFNVCAKTTTVIVAPAYQQAFKSQHRTLQSWVTGDVDETGTWSIVSQPSGGDAALADTTNRDADFVATVTGRYTLRYTSHSDAGKSATAIVYVSPNPMPAYASTPNLTEPRECFVDPALTGGDYEIGAGKAYPSLQSTPAANTLAPGSILRIWNTDTTGAAPSRYSEDYQVASTGTPTQPILICGVPDVHGNLPVIDGANATIQPGASTGIAGLGIVSIWAGGYGNGTPFGYWQGGSGGPNYVSITGLHIAHGNETFNYVPPGGGALTPYAAFSACIDVRSGAYIDLSGNDIDTCGLGLFTAENSSSGWINITQAVTVMGNHIHLSGEPGQDAEHQVYFQSWYGLLQGNLIDHYLPTASGSEVKWRGVEGIFRYNNLGTGAERDFDLVDNQDAIDYVTFEGYLGAPGDTNCNDSAWCSGDQLGANRLAGFQESFSKDFIYGNEIFGASAFGQVHYLADQVDGMQCRGGTLYFYSNTLDDAQLVFDTGTNGDGLNSYYLGRVDARNNILWAYNIPYPGAQITMAFGRYASIVLDATTNLMQTGTFSIKTPIMGANPSNGTSAGWSNQCDGVCRWPLMIPIDTHLYGLSDANYLTTATEPYNPVNMVPPAGSAAIEAGKPLTGLLANMPVRWQYSIASNSLVPRLDALTIGAVDYAAVAATPQFSPAAGSYNTAQTVTISSATPSATLHYTTDGSTPTTASTLYAGPITVAQTETVQAIAAAPGYLPSAVGTAAYGIGPPVATPIFTPPAGTYTSMQQVAIGTTTPSATIYYTTDGTAPTSASPVYSGPVSVQLSETLQAFATANGHSNSAVATASYTLNLPAAAAPVFTPAAGTYTSIQTVSISSITPNAAIYYTTDGTTPTYPASGTTQQYSGPVTVSVTETVKAIAASSGFSNSAVASADYVIHIPFAGPNYLQQCNGFQQYGATVSCTLDGVAAGDTLMIGVSNLTAGQQGTVTSSAGTPVLATSDANSLQAWILPNASQGSITITFTVNASSRLWLSVAEFNNAAALPLDGVGQANVITWQGNGLMDTPRFTTTSALDALWTFCSSLSGKPALGTGPVTWNALPPPAGSSLLVEYGDATSAGSYYGECGGNQGEIVAVALKPPSALTPAGTPQFSPPAGTYTSAQNVSITTATTAGAPAIYYTTDGTDPSTSATAIKYATPLAVASTQTILAVTKATGYANSAVASAAYTINLPVAATPSFTPAAGVYTTVQTVSLSDSTAGAAIYYTLDGSTPTTASAKYSTALTVSQTTTIKAIAAASGYTNSAVASAAYTINLPAAATPAFSVVAGVYTSVQNVKLTSATSGASIYYTLDGSTPSAGSAKYSAPISVSQTETIKAIAVAANYSNSAVASASYTINLPAAAAPTFSPAGGTFTAAQSVKLASTTAAASIYYTLDGSTPSAGSAKYSAPISVSKTTTIKAITAAANFSNSAVASATYTMNLPTATPTFTPAAGAYTSIQSVALTDATPNATIYYTVDGSAPTAKSAAYSTPLTVSKTTTIKALATAPGYTSSSVASATYTISLTAAAPSISPAAGTYGAAQLVTLATGTPGATIYYTTNGAAPTTSSTKYTAPVAVTATGSIKAMAVATGYANSPAASAAYTLIGSPQALSGLATGITASAATLNATVNGFGATGQVWFLWGTSSGALNSSTAKAALAAATSGQSITAALSGLTTATQYYFQPVASTPGGITYGAVQSFTTH